MGQLVAIAGRGLGKGLWPLRDFWMTSAAPEPTLFQVPAPPCLLLPVSVPEGPGRGPGWSSDWSVAED